jgi:hypothetical protein
VNILFGKEMKSLLLVLLFPLIAMPTPNEDYGVIAKIVEDGKPVVLRISRGALTDANRAKFPWLVIVGWKYEGGAMPAKETNGRMIQLEDALEDQIVARGQSVHAVSRTGNGLKEWEYYITDRDDFIERLNQALTGHERYPIEITFYSDPEWKELKRFIGMLEKEEPNKAAQTTAGS